MLVSAIICIGVYFFCGRSEDWIRARVVKLSSPHGMCSGEQVRALSGVDYILTAGHCRALSYNDEITVTDSEGRTLQRKIIAEDRESDLLLLEGLPGLKGLDVANSSSLSEHVRTFTHGSNLNTFKTEGEIIEVKEIQIVTGILSNSEDYDKCQSMPKYKVEKFQSWIGSVDVCTLKIEETTSSASITPGSSGGMLVDDSGELVGVASATDGHFGYFVTLPDIRRFLNGY